MKKIVFFAFILALGCASGQKRNFSYGDIVITRMSGAAFDPSSDSQTAAGIACKALGISDCSTAGKFVKKSRIKKGASDSGSRYFYAVHYFDSASFLSHQKYSGDAPAAQTEFYASSYSTQEKTYDYFTSSLKDGCFEGVCIKYSNMPFPQDFPKNSDFAALAEIYSYYLNNPINSSITFISSATVKVYYVPEKKLVSSFEVTGSATSFDLSEAAYKSLSACGESAAEKTAAAVREYSASAKKIKLIFSNVADLNTLGELRSILDSAFGPRSRLSYYRNKEACFTMPFISMPEEILAGEIMRRGDLKINIEYIDRGELKFSVGENVVNR